MKACHLMGQGSNKDIQSEKKGTKFDVAPMKI
jgi:hypothetical protein